MTAKAAKIALPGLHSFPFTVELEPRHKGGCGGGGGEGGVEAISLLLRPINNKTVQDGEKKGGGGQSGV